MAETPEGLLREIFGEFVLVDVDLPSTAIGPISVRTGATPFGRRPFGRTRLQLLLPRRPIRNARELAAVLLANREALAEVVRPEDVNEMVRQLQSSPDDPPSAAFSILEEFNVHPSLRPHLRGEVRARFESIREQAIEVAEQRPDMTYVPGEGFYHWAVPGIGQPFLLEEEEEDLILIIQGQLPAYARDPDTGQPTTRAMTMDEFVPPALEDDRPFIGGIPTDFVTDRLIPSNIESLTTEQMRQEQATLDEFIGRLRQVEDPRIAEARSAAEILQAPFGAFADAARQLAGQPLIRFAGADFGEFARPVHREFDEFALFASKDEAYRAGVQRSLIEGGYLEIGQIAGSEGWWTKETGNAARQWLFEANVAGYGHDPFAYLEERAATRRAFLDSEVGQALTQGSAGGGGGVRVPAFVAPDYATLTQAVRQAIRTRLGRDPHDYEIALLADQMAADFRAQYEAEVAALRRGGGGAGRAPNHVLQEAAELRLANIAEGRESEEGVAEIMAQYQTGGGGGGGTVQGVDPFARLAEAIEGRFATEIERREQVAETHFNTRHMMRVLAGLEGAVR